jgi:hypothetical protein
VETRISSLVSIESGSVTLGRRRKTGRVADKRVPAVSVRESRARLLDRVGRGRRAQGESWAAPRAEVRGSWGVLLGHALGRGEGERGGTAGPRPLAQAEIRAGVCLFFIFLFFSFPKRFPNRILNAITSNQRQTTQNKICSSMNA